MSEGVVISDTLIPMLLIFHYVYARYYCLVGILLKNRKFRVHPLDTARASWRGMPPHQACENLGFFPQVHTG